MDLNTENELIEIAFPVGQRWNFVNINNQLFIDVIETEYISITDMVVGRVRYPDGFWHLAISTASDVHFVAFNTDRDIDRFTPTVENQTTEQ